MDDDYKNLLQGPTRLVEPLVEMSFYECVDGYMATFPSAVDGPDSDEL